MALFCQYCFQPVQASDSVTSLQFDRERRVLFHDDCYIAFRRKCVILSRGLRALHDGSYLTYLHASSTESVSPLSIPDQSEVNCVCPICMDNRADSLLLPCGHRTCSDCLLDWRRKSICKSLPGTACPFCRRIIKNVMKV